MLKKGLCVCPRYGCVIMWDCSLSFKLIADNYVALHLRHHLLFPSSWAGFKNDLFCEVLCLHTSFKWHTQSFTTHSPLLITAVQVVATLWSLIINYTMLWKKYFPPFWFLCFSLPHLHISDDQTNDHNQVFTFFTLGQVGVDSFFPP